MDFLAIGLLFGLFMVDFVCFYGLYRFITKIRVKPLE
tara:strand:- start:4271 stop:4381 length:111 start_codon:yes stop_codon:yes gene_type:complete